MKAAVFYGKHDLRVQEIDKPTAKAGQVLVKVMACGICGTDVHIFNGDEGAAPTPSGTVLGHEFAGVVESVGDGVKGIKAGDRVCVDPNEMCGECYYCKNGIGHYCENMGGIGTVVNGGFAQYCVVPQSQVYKIADGTSYEKAAMTEPLACCLHGIDMCNISCGDTVLVIGGGMIGQLMLQLARISGAGKLIMLEPVQKKRDEAKVLGADICIDPLNENVKEVLKREGIERISTVIECVGKPSTMSQAIELAGNKATVMLFGLTAPNDEISIKPFEIFKKELIITASYINPYTQKRSIDLIDAGKVDVSSMVYRVAPLEELPAVLADGKLRAQGKFIICPWMENK